MSDRLLKVLMLEDSKNDVTLLKRAVLKIYPSAVFTVATNESEFIERSAWDSYDLVLSDYRLPDYNGLRALIFIRQNSPFLPFIFVTGTLDSEEDAAQAILHGANGYVLKNDLSRLGGQMESALAKSEEDRTKAEQEANRRRSNKLELQRAASLLDNAPDFPAKADIKGAIEQAMRYA